MSISRQFARRLGLEVSKGRPRIHRAERGKRTWNGEVYDSAAELYRGQELHLLRKTGKVKRLNRQVLHKLAGISYRTDYDMIGEDDQPWSEEVMGYAAGKTRWPVIKQLWALYGPWPLIVLTGKPGRWQKEIINPYTGAKP